MTRLTIIAALLAAGLASAQVTRPLPHHPGNVIVPQTRAFVPGAAVRMSRVEADVSITGRIGVTTLIIHLENPSPQRLEAELLVPVAPGATVRGFTFKGAGAESTAALLPRDEARNLYNSIVARERDPALLEFAGYDLVRSSVFPVEPRGSQWVRLQYENLLEADGPRVDYTLPRSESLEYAVPWTLTVGIAAQTPISTVYSPSHEIDVRRVGPSLLTARVAGNDPLAPGPFRLSYLLEEENVSASVMACPSEDGSGGHFLLLAGLPAELRPEAGRAPQPREITLVLDRSGSMNGEKLAQVKEAALQIIAGLDDGEWFNVIVYNESVDRFSDAPLRRTADSETRAREYISGIRARGGTNISDALRFALEQRPAPDALRIVLFLTDGLPTVGQTAEKDIRDIAVNRNPHNRRLFTFGVGADVNTPLLEKLADATRGRAAFVLAGEDVEVKVAQVFRRLSVPVLAEPRLSVLDANGRRAPGRVRDVTPLVLPDLFEGDQLVVLGEYIGEAPLRFELDGVYLGRRQTFLLPCALDRPHREHSFVPRLWASRKIALLIDAIRSMGADIATGSAASSLHADPRAKELIDEIVRLSTEFGILTEYTAFLAQEGVELADIPLVNRMGAQLLDQRAQKVRSGVESVNQELNQIKMKNLSALNHKNAFLDAQLRKVEENRVQQTNDLAFFRRGAAWVDSRVARKTAAPAPDQTVDFGSPEFFRLLERLVQLNRQGALALRGDIVIEVDGRTILIRGPHTP